jgi:hypothetical protein
MCPSATFSILYDHRSLIPYLLMNDMADSMIIYTPHYYSEARADLQTNSTSMQAAVRGFATRPLSIGTVPAQRK